MSYASEVLADSPVGYWRLGESAGPTAVDASGFSNDGTYAGSPTYGVTGAVEGNTAVTLTTAHAADLVDIDDDNSLDVGDVFTVEFWLKRSSQTGLQCVIDKGDVGASAFCVVFNGADFYFGDSGGEWIITALAGVCNDITDFHYIVITKNGATTKLYQDGVDITPATTNFTIHSSTSVLRFGATVTLAGGNTWWLDGTLDEVALYPTPLSQDRVTAHYEAAFPVQQAMTMGMRRPIVYG